jgi:DNA-binding XRE family transcriptional regulator
MNRLDAAKLERLGRLVCGPLWQSELARTMGVSRQTVLRWAAGEFAPSLEYTAKAKELVRSRIGELQRLLKEL